MKTIKIDECIRRVRSYAMQFEAEGKKNISEDLWVAVDFLKRQTTMCFDCTRRRWYMKGYQDGLNADKWIPCEERLPSKEECGRYARREFQVTIPQHDGNRTVSMDFVYETVRGEEVARWKWDGRLSPWEVLAWKPLDEPYKKEGAENE